MIKFNKHNVTDTDTKRKARVYYWLSNRNGQPCVVIQGKTVLERLDKILPFDYENDSDAQSDYSVPDQVVFFEWHRYYAQAFPIAKAAMDKLYPEGK